VVVEQEVHVEQLLEMVDLVVEVVKEITLLVDLVTKVDLQ
tara:strand:+ start:125 stop:244 length:120 start_codon:yes stop_codon:yes gene_type:complete